MLKIYLYNLIIISFFLASCSAEVTTTATTDATYPTSVSGVTASGTMSGLSGTYATVCSDASSMGTMKPADATHIGFVLVITGSTTFTREINYYKDSACTSLSLGWYFNNTSYLEGVTSGTDTKVTYTQANQTFLAKTTEGETFIEALFGAGFDVTVGTVKVTVSGVTYYNLIKGSDSTINFGVESPTAYPSSSEGNVYYKQ